MKKYVAFLRGINVGGKKIIKMIDLQQMFISMGLSGVKTFIQSGNVIFQNSGIEVSELTNKIESGLHESLGYEVPVILRTFDELESIIILNPFKKVKFETSTKLYVSFLKVAPASLPQLPLKSRKDGLEVIEIIDKDAFILSFPIKDRFGFPNNFIEKELGISATSRNWNTVVKIYEMMKKHTLDG